MQEMRPNGGVESSTRPLGTPFVTEKKSEKIGNKIRSRGAFRRSSWPFSASVREMRPNGGVESSARPPETPFVTEKIRKIGNLNDILGGWLGDNGVSEELPFQKKIKNRNGNFTHANQTAIPEQKDSNVKICP